MSTTESVATASHPGESEARPVDGAASREGAGWRERLASWCAAPAWVTAAVVTQVWPDHAPATNAIVEAPQHNTGTLAVAELIFAGLFTLVLLSGRWLPGPAQRLRRFSPWLAALAGYFLFWEIVTAKAGLLVPPYWAAPQLLITDFRSDHAILLESLWASFRLLMEGFVIGASVGFAVGVAMGWSKRVNYWMNPILRTLGPIPPVCLVPILFVAMPSTELASMLLIALATWFPVTVLTFSGVNSVNRQYYDVASTLGASNRFLVWRVAIPAALPSVSLGLFMGLGMTFPTLIVAEMLGVKHGLGWYIQWQQNWSDYPKMYVAICIMIVLCSGLFALLFYARRKVLAWQQDLVRW
jgi:NitT/TauT family transport system permease protein